MVLAQAHADTDEPEAACDHARKALEHGDHLKSTRCVQYVAEFRRRLARFRDSRVIREFSEEATDRRLWRRALARESER